MVAQSLLAFLVATSQVLPSSTEKLSFSGATAAIEHPVCHIVEQPGGIEFMTDCEVPTEEYYDRLAEDLRKRHPKAASWVLEHAVSLEAFLDTSIVAGFSYGVDKAQVAVTSGKLLGHVVCRTGASAESDRVQAIVEFAPLKEPSHVR